MKKSFAKKIFPFSIISVIRISRTALRRSLILTLALSLLVVTTVHAQTFTFQQNIGVSGGCVVDWGDYDNDGDLDMASIGINSNNAGTFTQTYGELYFYPTITFDYPISGDKFYLKMPIGWADIDGDGLLDAFGNNGFCKNNGTSFTGVSGGVEEMMANCVPAMIDFDRDGDIDGSAYTKIAIFENGVRQSLIEWVPLRGQPAWGDYDNDGDLDLMMASGFFGNCIISKLYRNVNGVAVEDTSVTFPTTGSFNYAGASWGDYDNDGDLDLMFSSYQDTRLYRNDDGVLVHQAGVDYSLAGHSTLGGSWADFDNDGDLDILFGERLLVNDNGVFSRDADSGLDTQFIYVRRRVLGRHGQRRGPGRNGPWPEHNHL